MIVAVRAEKAAQALPPVLVVMPVPVVRVMPAAVLVMVAGRVRCHRSLAGSGCCTGAAATLEVHRASTLPHRQ